MTRALFSTTTWILLTALPVTASASDLTRLIRSMYGAPPSHHAQFQGPPIQPVGHPHPGTYDRYRSIERYRTRRPYSFPVSSPRSRVSFGLSIGGNQFDPGPVVQPQLPTVPVIPPAVAPQPRHSIGDFVTCPVPLATCVVVKDADEIAPGAIPVVVAVRDPHLGRFRSRGCVESVVYVQVYVPPCPLRRLRVSPCRTRVRLDYGDYDIDIRSCNDVIEIDYDD